MTATTDPFAPTPPEPGAPAGPHGGAGEPGRPAMSHRQVLEAMSGLLLAMFVAILSSTVVSTALPQIIGDLGGSQSAYTWQTAVLVGAGVLLCLAAVLTMRRSSEPLIPLRLFGNRSVVLAVIASIAVGIAIFGTTVFLSQYMQVARGKSPTESGLLTIPMVVGLFLASTFIGRLVSRTGRYKRFLLLGSVLLTVGLGLMGMLDEQTGLVELGMFMFVMGAGVGMLMQNLVLVVQNTVRFEDIGAGSSLVAFFRSLGGAIGVSVLGALLAHHASSDIRSGLSEAGIEATGSADQVPDVSTLPAPVAHIVEHAYGTGVGEIFLTAAPLGLVALAAVALLREVPLGGKSGIDIARERASTHDQQGATP